MERILLLLGHRENALLLRQLLAPHFQVVLDDAEAFDLCICDGPSLLRRRAWLDAARAAAAPVFLPVLLTAPRREVGPAARQLWRTVDELIYRPLEKSELQARVEMLLRARRLSLALRSSEEALRRARDGLEQRVAERTAALAMANTRLRQEIREREAAEEQLRLHAKVFESNAEGVLILDGRRRIVSANRAFCTISGFSPEAVLGRSGNRLARHVEDPRALRALWRAVQMQRVWQGELRCRRRGGEVFPAWVSVSAVAEGGRIGHYIVLISDIAERKRTQERLDYLTHYDFLTGLANLDLLRARFEQQVARRRPGDPGMALLLVDLDRFKYVNESYGHGVGDRLLKQVARRLRHCVSRDDLVARQGGDEFVLLVTGLRPADVARLADHVLGQLRQSYRVDDHELSLAATIGISLFPSDGRSLQRLLQNADAALHHAKAGGRDHYQFFSPEMNARALSRLTLEHQLRQALERDEFELHFQPQMDLRRGVLVGCEALLRWHHPQRGLLGPSRFMSVAEESGLVSAIGHWVLHQACAEAAAWQRQGGPRVPVAVNLSAVQFRHSDIAGLVERTLAATGLASQWLELELTESIIMEEPEAAVAQLRALRAMGLRLALDDFGTGYSSLSYLKRFPLEKLKIDQGFVRDLDVDADDAAIVTAVIALARNLRMRVIAEGVETEAQLAFLRGHQCDEIQGFLYSRPLPADAFRAFAHSHGQPARQRAGDSH